MAHVAVARPLPIVLQSPDLRSIRRPRAVSSSSSTDESAPSSSDPHSGESWFQGPASQTSHSSASSCPPLPKGARPASPQPTRFFDLDGHSHASDLNQTPSPLRRSSTFSSWKLEWRGISKVVKWAVLGDKSEENESGLHNKRAGSHKSSHAGNYTKNQRRPSTQRPDQGSQDSAFSSCIYASSLLPLTSTTCPDTMLEGQYSEFSTSEVHLPSHRPSFSSDELLRRHGSVQVSRHVTHVRELKNTNVRHVASECGHGRPYPTHGMPDTFSNVDRSTTSLDSIHDWPRRPRAVHSDLGHSNPVGYMPAPALPSTLSVSYGPDRPYFKSGTKGSAFKNIQSMQSAVVLSVSTSNTSAPLEHHQRPRKLRKSLRAMPTRDLRSSHPLVTSPTSSNSGLVERKGAVVKPPPSNLSHGPPVPSKHPRPPRKLKKRPSPALPPIPRSNSRDTSGEAPPVPPKHPLPLQCRTEIPPPVADSHGSSAGAESPPTGSSGSSSADDESHLPQDSSATSENLSEENALTKRPSLLRTESNRRWTVAFADVPDDLFIEELERLRRMGLRAGDVHGVYNVTQTSRSISAAFGAKHPRDGAAENDASETSDVERTKSVNAVLIQQVDTEDEVEWLRARRAILCCRELVRTERSYQERLQEVADGNVSDAVPALLVQYLPALIGASKVLSARFNEDMSAYGVSNAFLNVSSTLERALVPWCGVVGEFFSGNSSTVNAAMRKRDTTIPGYITEEETYTEFGAVKVRCMSMHGHDKEYMSRSSSARLYIPDAITTSSSSHWLFRPAFAQGLNEPCNAKEAAVLRKSLRRREDKGGNERRRKPPFRDLAILPTQRVTRYVLLYKDLLKHTPTSSPTRSLVEKAVETAVVLAKKCDRAQNHSSFLYHN